MQRREKSKEPMKRSLVLSTPFPHFFVLILQRPFSTRRMFPTSMESVDSSAHDPLTVEDRRKWVRNWRNGCRYATSPGTRRPCIIDLFYHPIATKCSSSAFTYMQEFGNTMDLIRRKIKLNFGPCERMFVNGMKKREEGKIRDEYVVEI